MLGEGCVGKWLEQHGCCRRAQGPHIVARCVVSAEVDGIAVVQTLIVTSQLVRDPLFDRQPVQLAE